MTDEHSLPLVSESDCNPVPVFNCRIILRKDPTTTAISGRVANLSGITAAGATERDVLLQLAKKFKETVKTLTEKQTDIPWIDPPEEPGDGEVERFVPVHL